MRLLTLLSGSAISVFFGNAGMSLIPLAKSALFSDGKVRSKSRAPRGLRGPRPGAIVLPEGGQHDRAPKAGLGPPGNAPVAQEHAKQTISFSD